MKKILPAVIIIIGIIITAVTLAPSTQDTNYIRVHIRANSNDNIDQSVKYAVKDKVVEYITPLASDITSFQDMYATLEDNLDNIKSVVDKELLAKHFNYFSTIRLAREQFPTRSYEELTLNAGIYDALIIELGSGTGDNWWCVAYPPLCFSEHGESDDKVVYKSKIAEWIGKIIN